MSSLSPFPRILVVEDEFLIRMTLVEALVDEGFDVLEAESGDEALPMLLADRTIRLLLTDIRLPGDLDGHELAERARNERPDLPIIFMTGQLDSGDRSNGHDLFISKPYTLTDICDAARQLTACSTTP